MQVPQPPRQPPALTAFAVQPTLQPQPSTLLGIPLTGRVDTQFDAGYFVTIQAGSQEFKGGRELPLPYDKDPHACKRLADVASAQKLL